MTDDDMPANVPQPRFLDALMTTHRPARPRAATKPQPFWAPDDQPTVDVSIPSYTWTWQGADDVADWVHLDHNASFVAPLSGTYFAFNHLVRTGAHADTRRPLPGYHLVDVHHWSDSRMPSPLGGVVGEVVRGARTVERSRGGVSVVRRAWVGAPHVELLHQLTESGHWPDITVYDSYTPKDGAQQRFEAWAKLIHDTRADAIRSGEQARVDAVKDGPFGYVRVFQTFVRPEDTTEWKSKIKRPDWNHTIRSAHGANLWRKLWRTVTNNRVQVLRIEKTDAVYLARADYERLLDDPDSHLKFDQSGIKTGAFKVVQ